MDDFYLLSLASIVGMGPVLFRRVFEKASSLEQLPGALPGILKLPGLAPEISSQLQLLASNNTQTLSRLEKQFEEINRQGTVILNSFKGYYPKRLREIPASPPVIFVRGNVSILDDPQLAIVGSRKPTAYGKNMAEYFSSGLACNGLVITSGLALGVDAVAHRACLDSGQKTIAVMANGIDGFYPRRNADLGAKIIENGGAVITEFAPGFKPLKSLFPRRNRLISGLSLGSLVIEAAEKSGSLITAAYALEQNREVFAVPGALNNPMSKGCNQLIRQGATLVQSVEQLLEELPGFRGNYPQASFVDIGNEHEGTGLLERQLLKALQGSCSSIDSLADQLQQPINQLQVALIQLELKGLVEQSAGAIMLSGKASKLDKPV